MEKVMPNWRKALVIGSLSAGALMFIKGHRPAGIALATVGLVVLAAEYPDKFETAWEQAPEYHLSRHADLLHAVAHCRAFCRRSQPARRHRGLPRNQRRVRALGAIHYLAEVARDSEPRI